MFKSLAGCFLVILFLLGFVVFSTAEVIVVDNFDEKGITENALGEPTGVWNCNDQDPEQGCTVEITEEEKMGDLGGSLSLTYDLSTSQNYLDGFPNTAYNGYWTRLGSLDISEKKYLTFNVKGNRYAGFTRVFWVELKDVEGNVSRAKIRGVSDKWKKVQIPLAKFSNIRAELYELVFVFDQVCTSKEGTIYIDNIRFE